MKIIAITPNKKRDYTTELVVDGLLNLGVEIIASDLGNGITKSFSDEEILKVNDANFVLAFFGKVRDNQSPKYYLLNSLKNKFKIAYIDGSEWTYTGYQMKDQMINSLVDPSKRRGHPWINHDMLNFCDLYFKRECYKQDLDLGIIPLLFGMTPRHLLNDEKKDIDVMCVFGQHSTGMRKEITNYCYDLKQKTNYNIVVSNSLNEKEYREVLSRSRIVIDAWGGGDNCDRFYEAIGAGACCLYQKYQIEFPDKFEDFVHAVSYDDMSSFSNNLNFLLKEKELSLKIGIAGKQHGLLYHTSINRAKTVIERMSKL
ncbi:MAG: glycosyltransferase family 1 protein [Proteobacteria bacterium]|nr:glycosyltransferase family 1 protein [Pseudomonadota bacterium]